MKTAFNGLGQEFVTFRTEAGASDAGAVCRAAGDGAVSVCAAGDDFFGVIEHVRDGAACVQTGGYVELVYTGAAPEVGWCALTADGAGGVQADEAGHEFLVISVDTDNTKIGMWL